MDFSAVIKPFNAAQGEKGANVEKRINLNAGNQVNLS